MKKNIPIILDCTIRDGGYYNAWDFDIDLVKKMVINLRDSGVNVIELGYKSNITSQWNGLFKYCQEQYLDFLHGYDEVEYAFMLDVKEFISQGKICYSLLDPLVVPKHKSIFSWCRLAFSYEEITYVKDLVQYIHDAGYKVCVNLMGVSLLEKDERHDCFQKISSSDPDVFYFADSFGSMYPDDITRLVTEIRHQYDGTLGLHAHDNQGMAFANALSALKNGVTYIDSTITGMGRGAGNLATEQFILWASEHLDGDKYQANELLSIIEEYFGPEKSRCGWGHNYVYMLSGLKNIHPSYCMNISEGNKFSTSQISHILDTIPIDKKKRFSKSSLDMAVNKNIIEDDDGKEQKFTLFDITKWKATTDECLIIAPGQGVMRYKNAVKKFYREKTLQILECNYTNILEDEAERLLVVFNEMRLKETLDTKLPPHATIVTGVRSLPVPHQKKKVFHFPYELGPLDISPEELQIPDYEAGEYTISLAILLGYKRIYLAGFSGYGDHTRDEPMNRYFKQAHKRYPDIQINSITPTIFKNISIKSIFAL